jgi:hypothetical protein
MVFSFIELGYALGDPESDTVRSAAPGFTKVTLAGNLAQEPIASSDARTIAPSPPSNEVHGATM